MGLSFGGGKDGQQQGRQYGNNGNHHQQFNERKGRTPLKLGIKLVCPSCRQGNDVHICSPFNLPPSELPDCLFPISAFCFAASFLLPTPAKSRTTPPLAS